MLLYFKDIFYYRVVPRIADELKVKVAKASAAAARKKNKDSDVKRVKAEDDEKDEFDMMLEDKALNK